MKLVQYCHFRAAPRPLSGQAGPLNIASPLLTFIIIIPGKVVSSLYIYPLSSIPCTWPGGHIVWAEAISSSSQTRPVMALLTKINSILTSLLLTSFPPTSHLLHSYHLIQSIPGGSQGRHLSVICNEPHAKTHKLDRQMEHIQDIEGEVFQEDA